MSCPHLCNSAPMALTDPTPLLFMRRPDGGAVHCGLLQRAVNRQCLVRNAAAVQLYRLPPAYPAKSLCVQAEPCWLLKQLVTMRRWAVSKLHSGDHPASMELVVALEGALVSVQRWLVVLSGLKVLCVSEPVVALEGALVSGTGYVFGAV